MKDEFIKRWQLAWEENITPVVVMSNITKSKIDLSVKEVLLVFDNIEVVVNLTKTAEEKHHRCHR